MSELAWAQDQLRHIAPTDSVKERIRNAARVLQWTHSRTKAVWYADDRVSLRAHEVRRITQLTGVEYGRQERAELDRLIERANTLLMGTDPDFLGAFVDALGSFARAYDRARTRRGTGE